MGHNATSLAELTKAIADRGLWKEFEKARDKLIASDIPADEANRIAASDMVHNGTVSGPSDRVMPSDFDGSGRTSMLADVEWVYNHLAFAVDDLDRSKCPSAGAWQLLLWVKADNQSEFYKSFVPKLLPTRAQLDDHDPFKDDGTEDVDQIDRVRRMAVVDDE